MKKLFSVYLGGRADGCNIELHDVVFAVGSTIEETYSILPKKWFGNLRQFHIDSYMELNQVDGHQILLAKEKPPKNSKKLYFVNLGAYRPGEFSEVHESAFYVAETVSEAVRKAKQELCKGLQSVHKDDVVVIDHVTGFDVDDVLEVDAVDDHYISLIPIEGCKKPTPVSAYIKLTAF